MGEKTRERLRRTDGTGPPALDPRPAIHESQSARLIANNSVRDNERVKSQTGSGATSPDIESANGSSHRTSGNKDPRESRKGSECEQLAASIVPRTDPDIDHHQTQRTRSASPRREAETSCK